VVIRFQRQQQNSKEEKYIFPRLAIASVMSKGILISAISLDYSIVPIKTELRTPGEVIVGNICEIFTP